MKKEYLKPEYEVFEFSHLQLLTDSPTTQQWIVDGGGTNGTGGAEDDESEYSRAPEFFGDLE